jgi:hypothetical protein
LHQAYIAKLSSGGMIGLLGSLAALDAVPRGHLQMAANLGVNLVTVLLATLPESHVTPPFPVFPGLGCPQWPPKAVPSATAPMPGASCRLP